MKPKREAQRWFQQAQDDLHAVQWNLEGEFYAQACFLAQQAAEKALKSLLFYLGIRRDALLTHSLAKLVEAAAKHISEAQTLSDAARELDLHYVASRYPNGLPDGTPFEFYTRSMAERAFQAAEEIVEFVRAYYRRQGEEMNDES